MTLLFQEMNIYLQTIVSIKYRGS